MQHDLIQFYSLLCVIFRHGENVIDGHKNEIDGHKVIPIMLFGKVFLKS